MHKINPDDLDAIFKEGADKYEFTYNDAAWADMSSKLDQRDSKRRLWLLLLFLVGIGITIGAWAIINYGSSNFISYSNEIDSPDKQLLTQSSGELRADVNTEKNVSSSEVTLAQPTQSTSTSTIVANENVTQNSVSASTDQSRQTTTINTDIKPDAQLASASEQVKGLSRDLTNTGVYKSNNEVAKEINHPSKFTPIVDESVEIAEKELELITQNEVTSIDQKQRNEFSFSSIDQLSNTIPSRQRDLSSPKFDLLNLRPTRIKTPYKYFFTIHSAAEWSSVGFLKEPSMGWKAGLGAGIALSKFVELSTGIGVSRKIYASDGMEYEMQGGWIESVMPEKMESKCYIIDVPLNATYYINGRNSHGFFLSAGVSSYIISSEWYGFEYKNEDIQQLLSQGIAPQEEVFEQNESHHYVGVANLSIGMQKILKDGLFIQFAPYVQIPLTGIGAGKVDLYSTGFKFSVKLNK